MRSSIILSICIPTYNRSSYLETLIISIVNQIRFQETNDVEIIISDNCSDDDTKKISLAYVKLYGEKIRYYRNENNIKDLNFAKALSYGQGLFLKLNNDTLKHQDGSLDNILKVIDENREERNILFFSNGNLKISHNVLCENLDSFVDNVSFWSGWIGAFGIWKGDFILFKNFNRCSHLQLIQVDVLFRLITSKKKVFVNNDKLFIVSALEKKGGYDLLTVFLDNYIFLLAEQFNINTLGEKTFVSEKRKLLLQFIRPWLVNIKIYPNTYYFGCKNSFRRIVRYYRKDILTLFTFIIYYNLSLFYNFAKKLIHFYVVEIKELK